MSRPTRTASARWSSPPAASCSCRAALRGDILLWEVASGKLLHKLVIEPAVYAERRGPFAGLLSR